MKNYITNAYIDMLHDKTKATGVYFNTPKVIKHGVKYRKALSRLQKDVYAELWDMAMKAAHKGQVDEKGRVYVEVADSFMAVAVVADVTTIKHNLNGTGKNGKYTELFDLGLIRIKKRIERETSEYYVMAPVYEGEDVKFLTNDITTSSHKADAEELKAKRNKNVTTKRKTENEQLEEERIFDTKADTAEYEIIEKETAENVPDFDEEPQPQIIADEKPSKQMYFLVMDDLDGTGLYSAEFIIEQNGKMMESWTLSKFAQNMKLGIETERKHDSDILREIMIATGGKYEIKTKERTIY
ncbi:hypothetical protein NDK43_06895 [Neobacillus pocheonensis]|uniref:Uncharacterized protein n=1 Tax=Neobacillus pocheonensis TaxID=363869 RepID=A0ABT0W771_9BACI|nr:hypothetical protein [Neobacillus pocheonensis]